jgi:hypothetical protein
VRFRKQSQPSTEELAAYLEGELSAVRARRMESALADSLDGRRRLHHLITIRERLVAHDPELERIDLVPALARAIAQPSAPRAAAVPAWACGVASLGLVGIALVFSLADREAGEYRPKSALISTPSKTRAGVQVWRTDATQPPQPVLAEISRADGLLFSVTNLGPTAFTHLMLFAVDAGAEIRWFYPAYLKQGTDPQSIPIAQQQVHALLPNLIHHGYATGPLTIFALFTYEPLHVSQVEAWLIANQRRPREPPLSAAKLQTFDLVVNP